MAGLGPQNTDPTREVVAPPPGGGGSGGRLPRDAWGNAGAGNTPDTGAGPQGWLATIADRLGSGASTLNALLTTIAARLYASDNVSAAEHLKQIDTETDNLPGIKTDTAHLATIDTSTAHLSAIDTSTSAAAARLLSGTDVRVAADWLKEIDYYLRHTGTPPYDTLTSVAGLVKAVYDALTTTIHADLATTLAGKLDSINSHVAAIDTDTDQLATIEADTNTTAARLQSTTDVRTVANWLKEIDYYLRYTTVAPYDVATSVAGLLDAINGKAGSISTNTANTAASTATTATNTFNTANNTSDTAARLLSGGFSAAAWLASIDGTTTLSNAKLTYPTSNQTDLARWVTPNFFVQCGAGVATVTEQPPVGQSYRLWRVVVSAVVGQVGFLAGQTLTITLAGAVVGFFPPSTPGLALPQPVVLDFGGMILTNAAFLVMTFAGGGVSYPLATAITTH